MHTNKDDRPPTPEDYDSTNSFEFPVDWTPSSKAHGRFLVNPYLGFRNPVHPNLPRDHGAVKSVSFWSSDVKVVGSNSPSAGQFPYLAAHR